MKKEVWASGLWDEGQFCWQFFLKSFDILSSSIHQRFFFWWDSQLKLHWCRKKCLEVYWRKRRLWWMYDEFSEAQLQIYFWSWTKKQSVMIRILKSPINGLGGMTRLVYRISSYSFRGNYSFLDLEIQRSQYINVRKLFKGGNNMRKYGKLTSHVAKVCF